MKKKLHASLVLLIFSISLSALESGKWLNEVTMEVETPHLEWAKNLEGGPLNILFVTTPGAFWHFQRPLNGARMAVEWAQRMDIKFEAVTAGRGLSRDKVNPRLSFDVYHPVGFEGIRPDEKEEELAKKLSEKYDLYVFNNISFDGLTPEAQKAILENVVKGAGLVLIGETKNQLPKMFKSPDLKLVEEILQLDYFPLASHYLKKLAAKPELWKRDSIPLRAYKLGKGKIIQLKRLPDPANSEIYYLPEWSVKYRKLPEAEQKRIRYYNEAPIPLWWGEFENLNASFLRLFYYAAGRKPQVSVGCPSLVDSPEFAYVEQEIKLELDNPQKIPGEIAYRVRNDENKILNSSKTSFNGNSVQIKLPVLPGGKYFLDIFSRINGKLDDFGIQSFTVKPETTASIEMDKDRIVDGKPIKFSLILSKPVENGTVKVTLADSPYDRIWYQKEFKTTNETHLQFQLKDWYLPNSAATLRVFVEKENVPIAYARKTLFRPQGNQPPPWLDLLWGESFTPLQILVNQASQGWNGVVKQLSGRTGTSVQNHMVAGEMCIPWGPLSNWHVFNNRHKRSVGYMRDPKTKETRPNWTLNEGGALHFGATKEEVDKINSMPAGMEHRLDAVREVLKIWDNSIRPFDYGLKIFTIGDETMPGYDTFDGKFANREFHKFLQQKFETIDELNVAWKRSYKDFADIPLLTTAEAKKQKLLPEGAAQREFAEVNYYDVYQTIGGEIKKRASDTFYGPVSSAYIEELKYSGLNASFAHPDTGIMELRHTMCPENLYVPLYGYEIKQTAYSNKQFWENIISGVGDGNMYFAANIYPEGGTSCVDHRDKMPNITEGRLMLLDGLGSLFRKMKVPNGKIAVLASSPSLKAKLFSPEIASDPALTSTSLFQFGKEHGIVIDHFTTDVITKFLPNYQVLILAGISAISKKDAEEIIKFVKNGGTVVADLNPGIYNEHLGLHDCNPLAELFGDLKPENINEKINFQGVMVEGVKGISPMSEKKVGKGKAVLMNFSLSKLRNSFGNAKRFDSFLGDFLSKLGITSPIKVSGLPKNSIIRLSHNHDFDMIAFANDGMASIGRGKGNITVIFPRKSYIYRIGKGFLGEGDTATVSFEPPFCFLTRFDKKQKVPEIKLSYSIATPGVPILLDITGFNKGRVLNLKIRDVKGKLLRPRNEIHKHELIIIDGKAENFPIHFAYTDPKGKYELELIDVATGLSSKKHIRLK